MGSFSDQQRITRLAPSPTGALHLGNARTFVINWVLARQLGWRIVLRIEDLDSPRVKEWAVNQAQEDLRWLGLDWDDGPFFQRSDLSPYLQALEKLIQEGVLYRCQCSRREIEQAQSAPHDAGHELCYPGTCRPASKPPFPLFSLAEWNEATAIRCFAGEKPVAIHDQLLGDLAINLQSTVGDFVVATKDGLPAYQLAVVVDDLAQGVTDVIRGDDLVNSAARQAQLYRYLRNDDQQPTYWHLPLVVGSDGRRLAKRHGDTRLNWYREHGVKPERIIGLLGYWSGIQDHRNEIDMKDWLKHFDIQQLPREAVTFSQEDHAWLIQSER